MNERRFVKVAIKSDLLFDMIEEGYEILRPIRVTKGLPKGAKFIYSYFDNERMIGYMVFEHQDFAPVCFGDVIPIVDIHLKTWYEPEAEEIYKKAMQS